MRILLGLPPRLLRATARLLVLAMSVGALGPMLHGVHTEDCEPPFVVHDETAHHLQASLPDAFSPAGVGHCVACHFARSSRGPVSWELTGISALVHGTLLFHSDGELVAEPSASPVPARAPPRA